MTTSIDLVLSFVKMARDVKHVDLLIILDGLLLTGTPINRDEYASYVANEPTELGEGTEPEPCWFFLKDINIQGAVPVKLNYLAIDANKVSAINLKQSQSS